MFLLIRIYNRYDDVAAQYRIGRWGEEKAVEKLLLSLDGRWCLIRNFVWQNRKWGDIDLILIGPGGVWAFVVKAYSGKIRNIGDKWHKKGKFRWYDISTHPGKQARRNAVNLKNFLNDNGLKVKWVNSVVLWAGGLSPFDYEKGTLELQDPATPVWNIELIDDYIDELFQNSNFKDLKDEAVNLLKSSIAKAESK